MRKIILASAAALGLLALTAPAHSITITYDLDFEFSGGDEPAGLLPWVTLTFNDEITPGAVDLTISSSGLTSEEILARLYINFDDALDVNKLTFTPAVGNEATAGAILTGSNAFKADGDGFFDILFDYPPPSPGDTGAYFSANETVAYSITSSETITALSFDFFSVPGGGNGSYHAAGKIQRIGADAEGSGWIGDRGGAPVPEPATMLLFGVGGALAGFSKRRKKQVV